MRKHTIDEMKELAISRGFRCLSNVYTRGDIKLQWQCKCGYLWWAQPYSIINGCGCPKCARVAPVSVVQTKKEIEQRGGKLISKHKKMSACTRITIECKYGHPWTAIRSNVLTGDRTWCPICRERKKESLCRMFFERFSNKKFPKVRPAWLHVSPRHNLELDGFCSELNIAFEYQGEQHERKPNTPNGAVAFKKIKQNDSIKKELCLRHGITLFEIPSSITCSKLGVFILNLCETSGMAISNRDTAIDFTKIKHYKDEKISVLKSLARKKGFEILSDKYFGYDVELECGCSFGHRWQSFPKNICAANGCPTCWRESNTERLKKVPPARKYTIDDMKSFADSFGGKCLSNRFTSVSHKLRWQCACGNTWWATPKNVIYKHSRCPLCARKKIHTENVGGVPNSWKDILLSSTGSSLSKGK